MATNTLVKYVRKNKTKTGIYFSVFVILIALIWFAVRQKNKVVSIAQKFLGKEETHANKGFKDKNFEKDMKQAGWFVGGEWCAFFAKMIMLKSLKGDKRKLAQKLMSGSSQMTFNNFKKSASQYISDKPKTGAIVVWQSQSNKNKGHVGIVKKVFTGGFETIEGNVNENGSPGIVTQRRYNTVKSYNSNNLRLRGFINIV